MRKWVARLGGLIFRPAFGQFGQFGRLAGRTETRDRHRQYFRAPSSASAKLAARLGAEWRAVRSNVSYERRSPLFVFDFSSSRFRLLFFVSCIVCLLLEPYTLLPARSYWYKYDRSRQLGTSGNNTGCWFETANPLALLVLSHPPDAPPSPVRQLPFFYSVFCHLSRRRPLVCPVLVDGSPRLESSPKSCLKNPR